MTLQVIDHQKDIPALHHIILSDGSCHIRCQEQHRWHLIIESCHDDGMFHGSAGHQVLVYFFHIFLGLADGHVDTEDILVLLVHDGIQCDLGLAGLFVPETREDFICFFDCLNDLSRSRWELHLQTQHPADILYQIYR